MEMKIMLCGAMVLGGFLWSYLFLRQLVFNFRVANPLIKKMNLLLEHLEENDDVQNVYHNWEMPDEE